MNQKISNIIDISGKCLLAWFVYETYKYIFGGRFLTEIKQLSNTFQYDSAFWGIYATLKIPVASIGALILILLLLRGKVWGLILGITYWIMGNLINPLWFIIPYDMQVSPEGKATTLLLFANYFWSGVVLIIIVAFYFYRRSLKPVMAELTS